MNQVEDCERDTVIFVQDMFMDQNLRIGKLKEFVQSLLMDEHEEYGKIGKLVTKLLLDQILGTGKHEGIDGKNPDGSKMETSSRCQREKRE